MVLNPFSNVSLSNKFTESVNIPVLFIFYPPSVYLTQFFTHFFLFFFFTAHAICGLALHSLWLSATHQINFANLLRNQAALIFNGGRILSRPQQDLAPRRHWMSGANAQCTQVF